MKKLFALLVLLSAMLPVGAATFLDSVMYDADTFRVSPTNVFRSNDLGARSFINLSSQAVLEGPYPVFNVVALGDSITRSGDADLTNTFRPDGYINQAVLLSGGYIRLIANLGVSGQTSSNILLRIPEVIALRPSHCLVLAGPNDVQTYAWIPNAASNVAVMCSELLRNGITPVIGSVPPKVGSEIHRCELNFRLQEVARNYNVRFVDYYSALVDPTTEGSMTASLQDQLGHPNSMGAVVMARCLLRVLGIPGRANSALSYHDDTNNLVTNGIFYGWTGWAFTSTNSAGNARALLTNGWAFGSWAEVRKPADAGYCYLTGLIPTNAWAAGDRLNISARIWNDVQAGSGAVEMGIRLQGTLSTNYDAYLLKSDTNNYPRTAVMNYDIVIPAGTTNLTHWFGLSSGIGTARVAQVSVRNVTRAQAILPRLPTGISVNGLSRVGSFTPTNGWGARLMFDGANFTSMPSDAGWIIDEEFMGDSTTRSLGDGPWTIALTAGGLLEKPVSQGPLTWGVPGILSLQTTNGGDRAIVSYGNGFNGLTNAEWFWYSRIAVGTTNDSANTNAFFIGLVDVVTSDPANGIFFRNTSSANVWEVCTARNNSYSYGTVANVAAGAWVYLAWHLAGTGTNLDFFMGDSLTNLVWKTNFTSTTTITMTNYIFPAITSRKITGTTLRMTNYVDNFKLWYRRNN